MTTLEYFYRKIHNKEAPYYYKYSLWTIIVKPIRKYVNVVIIPNIPFNCLRIFLYRCCGFKIGKKCFIGMKCYLDDTCYDKITIEDNVTISYGVYFACHGRKQSHTPITIKKKCYIGMRSTIISGKKGIVLGENSIIGACALVNESVPDNAIAVGVPIKIFFHSRLVV
jgi:acetyltransferase-like isoleucine patch superfamily enzyme